MIIFSVKSMTLLVYKMSEIDVNAFQRLKLTFANV